MNIRKFVRIVSAVITIGLFVTHAFADDPATMPLTRGMLKAYAKSAAVSAHASVYGEAIVDGPQSQTHRSVSGSGTDELMETLFSKPLTFSVNNPKKDFVYGHASMADRKGRTLFAAWNKITFADNGYGRWYPASGYFFTFVLVDPVPLEIEGIQSARVIIRDDLGKLVRSEYLSVWDGAVYLPAALMEQAGELVLNRFIDDEWRVEVYNLSTGVRKYSTTITVWPWGMIENAFQLGPDQSVVAFGPVARDVLFSMKSTGQMTTEFIVYDQKDGQPPVGLRVSEKNQVQRVWYFVPRLDGRHEIRVPFPKGDWDIVPDWELPPEAERLRRLPDQYSGGKG